MKRAILMALPALMAFTLIGCGGSDDPAPRSTEQAEKDRAQQQEMRKQVEEDQRKSRMESKGQRQGERRRGP